MASVKLYLDTRHQRKDGTYALKLAVSHKSYFQIGLNVYIQKDEWINDSIYMPDHRARQKALDEYVQARLASARDSIYKLKAIGRLGQMSDKDLRYAIENDTIDRKDEAPLLFITHYNDYIAGIAKHSTRDTYVNMMRKLQLFADIQTLTFDDMNYAWMKDFEKFMLSNGLGVNTVSIYLRNIRTLFNDAIDRDLISQACYPFRKFKIKKEATRKRSLTVEQLRALRDYPCDDYQVPYRDMFMLIFYLRGINIVDLCNLQSINNGYIEYRRAKTGRLYSVRVEPEAMAIIEKYKGKDHLLDILDRYSDYRNYRHRMNMHLQEIGTTKIVNRRNGRPGKKEKQGLFPELTSYWARHSWATIAASLEIPKETIAAALGHGGNSVTDIYIDFDQRKVDQANRKVIDYVNGMDF